MRKSCINFQQTCCIKRAMRHVLRHEKKEPTYLLPAEYRRPTLVVPGSASTKFVLRRFENKKAMQTGQAKARGSSPFWEGVLLLPKVDGNFEEYRKRVEGHLREWALEYQRLTGHTVLHIAVHFDEGAMLDGEPHYNEHAHVQIDRTDDKGKVIKLGRAALSAVQDMTARVMEMERGETLSQRNGKRGRKHMRHYEFRRYAEAKREAEQSYESGLSDGAEAVSLDAALNAEKALKSAERKGKYLELRGFLKGCGIAKAIHYSALKKIYEASDERFIALGDYIQREAPDVNEIIKVLTSEVNEPSLWR